MKIYALFNTYNHWKILNGLFLIVISKRNQPIVHPVCHRYRYESCLVPKPKQTTNFRRLTLPTIRHWNKEDVSFPLLAECTPGPGWGVKRPAMILPIWA